MGTFITVVVVILIIGSFLNGVTDRNKRVKDYNNLREHEKKQATNVEHKTEKEKMSAKKEISTLEDLQNKFGKKDDKGKYWDPVKKLIIVKGYGQDSYESQETTPLNFDGVYQSIHKDGESWDYIRFCRDGYALTVSSSDTPSQLSKWFDKDSHTENFISRHTYIHSGNHVYYGSQSSKFKKLINHQGALESGKLVSNPISKSWIKREFLFVPF